MGLDCSWGKPGESKSQPLYFDPPLCFEDEHDDQDRREGWAFFTRARNFEDAIEEITGISLRVSTTWRSRLFFWRAYYRCSSCLTTRTVLKIAECLEAFAVQMEAEAAHGFPVPRSRFRRWNGSPLPVSESNRGWHYFSAEVYRDIARMFRAYGEGGYRLYGNW